MSVCFDRRFLGLALVLFGVEVTIALWGSDTLIRPFVGDVLVVALLYCLLRTALRPDGLQLALAVLLFACVIEVLQYLDYVALLGLEDNRVMSVLMGRTFSWEDFLAYIAGFLLCVALERGLRAQAG